MDIFSSVSFLLFRWLLSNSNRNLSNWQPSPHNLRNETFDNHRRPLFAFNGRVHIAFLS